MMRRLLLLPVWLVPGLCIATALVVTVRLMLPWVSSRSPDTLRSVRIEEQDWRKRVRRLQQGRADAVEQTGGRTLDEVRLTLLEALERASVHDGLKIHQVSIEATVLTDLPGNPMPGAGEAIDDGASAQGVTALRLALDAELPHAGHLIDVFERLAQSVSSFPAEVRGCSIERISAARGIRARCLYDVYHWHDPWLFDREIQAS